MIPSIDMAELYDNWDVPKATELVRIKDMPDEVLAALEALGFSPTGKN